MSNLRKIEIRTVPYGQYKFEQQIDMMDSHGYDLVTCGTGSLYFDGVLQHNNHAVYRQRPQVEPL